MDAPKLAVANGLLPLQKKGAPMDSQAAKTIARRALEGVWTAGGGVPAEDVYTSDVVSHQRSHPTVDDVHGINVLKSFVAEFHAGFPTSSTQSSSSSRKVTS